MRMLVCALLLCALPVHAAETPPPYLVAKLSRSICLGSCPSYTVSVYSDGRVAYQGDAYVKLLGKAGAKLAPDELEALRAAFTQASYFDLVGPFDCHEVTCGPSYQLLFHDGHRSRELLHYSGCRSPQGVGALVTLEAQFDTIVKSVRWVGTSAERAALQARMVHGERRRP
jgi:hypothetical protein